MGVSMTENRMKFKNLRRDPPCSVLVSPRDAPQGRQYIFSATTQRRSADWDEYDRIADGPTSASR